MLRHDFETSSDGESKQRNERILKSNPIHIVVIGAPDEFPHASITSEKRVQHRGFHMLSGLDLLRRPGATGVRGRLNVLANEPAAKSARDNLLDLIRATALQRRRYCRQIHLVCDDQVLNALADTPGIGLG